MTMRASTVGLIIGLVLGYFWIFHGVGTALLLALFAIVGWLIGKLLSGEVNLDAMRDVFNRR